MHQGSIETSEHRQESSNQKTQSNLHHGLHHQDSVPLHRARSTDSNSTSTRSVAESYRRDSIEGVDADQLDEKLRGLNLRGRAPVSRTPAAGQRISDYENALTPPTPRQALGFRVIKRSDSTSDGIQLTDFPNEILTHVLSHLHPDSYGPISLVSKRFYALVTMPHAWRMAFLRYFPGTNTQAAGLGQVASAVWTDASADHIQSETRFFSRLTPLATWRSEYLFRTRLIRSLARGKPGTSSGGIGSSVRAKSGKKASAVLTYNSKLPWLVTHLHAVFENGKKPPRAIQGAGDLGVATISDPTSGKIEKWGLEDPAGFLQLEEVQPNIVPYGSGDGPAAAPNVMDVSQPYGVLAGEGFPGGRPYFRGVTEARGRYLVAETGVVDTYPDIPKIPEMSEAVCCAWIAKSSAIPAATQSMIGMMTGSSLGVVTAYALGAEPSSHRHANGDITARWVLSPGVPIICLKMDDNYNLRRRASRRVWAVALNALGEVFYLTETPNAIANPTKGDDLTKNAWFAGRSVSWHLLEATRRIARPDELDRNAVRGAYSPRSPSNAMNLSKNQLAAEAREIEKFLLHKPSYFRKACEGWDMQRRLEVDFASDDGDGAGESIFVIDCGLAEDLPSSIKRYSRAIASPPAATPQSGAEDSAISTPSLFGPSQSPLGTVKSPEPQSPMSPPPTPLTSASSTSDHVWSETSLELPAHNDIISASALDCSAHSLTTNVEDPLHAAYETARTGTRGTTQLESEIPGRRARLLLIGTKSGVVLVWNARDDDKAASLKPVRRIQTESPEISCVAATALYIVHGGSDGLVQAWEPLGSNLEPIRTLNARSNGRVPRHMMTMNPTLQNTNYCAVGAIFLDPDPTVLRGIVSFGAFLRYWAYSSTGHPAGRKRRHRHSDMHGRMASRRQSDKVGGYIAAEEAELRRENESRAREQMRLRKRFGVGTLGDLTEEEAMRYAEIVSQEAYQQEEQRRASDSAADASLDTASSISETTADTVTPEPSIAEASPEVAAASFTTDDESSYEQQIQQAIRLSLLEGVNDHGQSPRGKSSGEYEFSVRYKGKAGKKGKRSTSSSPTASHTPVNGAGAGPSVPVPDADEDLAIALSLSMQDQERLGLDAEHDGSYEGFPPLETEGVGKGKGVRRW